jgi:hypothetical protein
MLHRTLDFELRQGCPILRPLIQSFSPKVRDEVVCICCRSVD